MKRSLKAEKSKWNRSSKVSREDDTQQARHLLTATPAFSDNVDIVDNSGQTALHPATLSGHKKIVEASLAEITDWDDGREQTVLYLAALSGHRDRVGMWIAKNPETIDVADCRGRTALHLAALGGHKKIVEMLLAEKPEIIDVVDGNSRTALYYAVLGDQNDCMVLLQNKVTIYTALQELQRVDSYLKSFEHLIIEHCRELLTYTVPDLTNLICDYIVGSTLSSTENKVSVVLPLLNFQSDISGVTALTNPILLDEGLSDNNTLLTMHVLGEHA